MKLSAHTLQTIEHLLTWGEVESTDLATLQAGADLGLWAPSEDGSRTVATVEAVNLLQNLPSLSEAVAAVLACEPPLRQAWQRITGDRLKELGDRRNIQELCNAIDTLGQAAGAILEQLPQASLNPTGYAELERVVFAAPAEQAIATPKLFRILGVTAPLVEGKQGQPTLPLLDVDPQDPSQNWIKGRLIRLPEPKLANRKAESKLLHSSILSGSWADFTPTQRARISRAIHNVLGSRPPLVFSPCPSCLYSGSLGGRKDCWGLVSRNRSG